jgi:soluble lytic murein transglycosylase
MRIRGKSRKTTKQAAAMRRESSALRSDLREVQVLLGDPYGTRRAVLENEQWRLTPQLLAERGPSLFPIAYPEVVRPLSEQFGLPPYYVYAIMTVESAFHPGAVSVSSAYGLVQVIPRTGENLARELGYLDFTPERLLDPAVSIYFGGYYLARLLSRFHGQEPLAAAAYNAGPHRVSKWLMARGDIPLDMFIEDIPYDQARGYTKTVLENIAAYRRIYHGEEHVYLSNVIDPTLGDGPNY